MEISSDQIYPIIIINLSILLIASWCFAFFIIRKLSKESQGAKEPNTKNKKEAPSNADVDTDSIEEFSETLNQLKDQFEVKKENLSTLEDLNNQQEASLAMWQSDDNKEVYNDIKSQLKQSQALIDQLQNDVDKSQLTIELLENQVLDSEFQSNRINILEKSEKRLKKQMTANKGNDEKLQQLADGLKTAKRKNQTLSRDNYQLKQNINKLSNASDKQLALIKKISNELEKASQLEEYQNQKISQLQKRLTSEKAQDSDSNATKTLEKELQEMNDKLERTIREKEFIESHLIEMDKTLEKSKEVEAAIDQSTEKISDIEKTYPEFEVDDTVLKSAEAEEPPTTILPKMDIDSKANPELNNIVSHKRLFGIMHEFWNSFETPPMHLLAEENITRPENLHHWVTTPLGYNQLSVVIGLHSGLATILQTLEGKKQENDALSIEETLVKMGQKTAQTLVQELNNDYTINNSQYSDKQTIENLLINAAVATETLQESKNEPLYAAIIQTSE